MAHKKLCLNCQRGIPIIINKDILCRKKGIVSSNYRCSKFKPKGYDNPINNNHYNCIDCENFILGKNEDTDNSIGYCHLFTVRLFDGTKKNICSKFTKKEKSHVS